MAETITFLFTDVAGSTRLWEQSPTTMGPAMARHDALVDEATERGDGTVVRPRGEGDSRFCVFDQPAGAVVAALQLQQLLRAEPWTTPAPVRVRAAIHTGEAGWREGDLYGSAVNRAARIRSLAHPGQTLLSSASAREARRDLPAGTDLRDLGWHRLKDLDDPEQVFQLAHPSIDSEFPPLVSAGVSTDNLPPPLNSFVGRDAELDAVVDAVGASRIVTVVGPGGAGKTRLATEAARTLRSQFRDGVWLAELAPVSDPAQVEPTLVAATRADRERLRSQSMLVVVDNAEHLAHAVVAAVRNLSADCPELRLLVTSREPLAVAGETIVALDPLPVPDAETTPSDATNPAMQLFVDRAKANRPDFTLDATTEAAVRTICTQLDGLPLALELAAARLRAVSVTELAAQLPQRVGGLGRGAAGDVAHHRTLDDSIAWSWRLLSEPERAVLARLSLFAGHTSADSVVAVCGHDLERDPVEILFELVDRSLVQRVDVAGGTTRYRLLFPIQRFAAARLDESQEAAPIRGRFIQWAVDLAQRNRQRLHGPGHADALDTLESERHNLDAALEHAETIDPAALMSICESLWWFWIRRNHLPTARRWLDRASELARTDRDRGIVLLAQGYLTTQVDVLSGMPLFAEAGRLLLLAGDRGNAARALSYEGNNLKFIGPVHRARQVLAEAADHATAAGETVVLAGVLTDLGCVDVWGGRYTEGLRSFEAALDLVDANGDARGRAFTLTCIGALASIEQRHDEAIAALEEVVDFERATHDPRMTIQALGNLCAAQLAAGRLDDVERTAREGLESGAQLEGDFEVSRLRTPLAAALHRRGRSVEARAELALATRGSVGQGDLANVTTCLRVAIEIHLDDGDPTTAARLLGYRAQVAEKVGVVPTPADAREDEAYAARARATLGDDGFEAAFAAGRALDASAGIELAVGQS